MHEKPPTRELQRPCLGSLRALSCSCWEGKEAPVKTTLWVSIAMVSLLATACFEMELDSSHEGWKQAECWSCHSRDNTHHSDKPPAACAACHGNNGASLRHEIEDETQLCGECHGIVHEPVEEFIDPYTCTVCHKLEDE